MQVQPLAGKSSRTVAARLKRKTPPVLELKPSFDNVGAIDPGVPGGKKAALAVTLKLIAALAKRNVRYCHWKSNVRLQDTLSGVEDIDLLVHRADAAPLREAMIESGFNPAQSRSGIGHPGVFHALALDQDSIRLAHLHAYYQIVSGDSLVKNYRLKIEDMLLENTIKSHGVSVPSPEAELVMFTVRIALKHVTPVEITMVNRKYQAIADEMAWLMKRADAEKITGLCKEYFPAIPAQTFQQLFDAIADPNAVAKRVHLGWRMAWLLRGQQRLGFWRAALSQTHRVVSLGIGRLKRRKDLALQTGGVVVALVGPKATGKSTLSAALAKALGSELNVRRIHAGKPPATLLTIATRAMLPLARIVFARERPSEYQKPERRAEQKYSLLHVFHMTVLAHERRSLLLRAFKMAAAGDIVVCDRYPSQSTGAIDSSCFDETAIANCGSFLKRFLMNTERNIYRGIPKPDLVLRLVAPIDTSLQRDARRLKHGGPDAAAVQRRWAYETQSDYSGVPMVPIDTNRPIDATVRDVVAAVWAAL